MGAVEWNPSDVDCGCDDVNTEQVAYDKIKFVTEKAVLFDIDEEEVWIPKSVIVEVDGDEVCVASWFAEREGLT